MLGINSGLRQQTYYALFYQQISPKNLLEIKAATIKA